MKNMRELIILFFCLILGINSAFAYDLVLPKGIVLYGGNDITEAISKEVK